MKRFLATLIVAALLLAMFPVTSVMAADPTSAWDEASKQSPLKTGTYTLTLNSSADYTLFLFKPDEAGVYSITPSSGNISYWGASEHFTWFQETTVGSVLERTIEQAGQTVVFGVSSSSSSVSVTIKKTADYVKEEIVYQNYVNVHTPSAEYNMSGSGTKVDITEYHTAVKGDDGFYHLDSSTGPLLYVDLIDDLFTLDISNYYADNSKTPSVKGCYDGVYYEFRDAMKEYNGVLDASGIYVMTEDLYIFIHAYGEYKGWWKYPHLSGFAELESGNFNEDTAWMILCYYQDAPIVHTHSYSAWIADGDSHYRMCACGEVQTASHTWNDGVVTTPATHLVAGVMTYTCTACAATKTEVIEKTAEHTYYPLFNDEVHYTQCACGQTTTGRRHTFDAGVVTTPATHLAEGVMTYSCTGCEYTKTEKIEKTDDHAYGAWIADGDSHYKECACGDKQTEAHTWNDGKVTTEATHLTEGVKTYTCTVCAGTKTEKIEKTAEHTYGAWIAGVNGHYKECACGDKTAEQAHVWDDGIVITQPTYTTTGETKYTCTVCAATKTEILDKLPEPQPTEPQPTEPQPTEPKPTEPQPTEPQPTEPQPTEPQPTEPIVPHEHEPVLVGKVEATCTEAGYTGNTVCADCEEILEIGTVIPATGHSYGDWQQVQIPACTVSGLEERVCACGQKETRVVAKLGHNYQSVVTAPTCTEDGYTTYTCTRCDDSYKGNYVMATGHSYGAWTQVIAPTCTEKGVQERVCACGQKETKEVAKLSHKYSVVVTAATCTERGYTTSTCVNCGNSYNSMYMPALGHNYQSVITAPTCTEDGYTTHTCANCSDSYQDTPVAALGHAYEVTTTAGSKVYTCKHCGDRYTEASEDGWKRVDGVWYLYENGVMLTGWQYVDGAWYYMDAQGRMQTGWQYIGGAWYYLNIYGRMETGWQYIDGDWYYMNIYGRMETGWQYINGYWYYLNIYGRMETGWIQLNGVWYFLNAYGAWVPQ